MTAATVAYVETSMLALQHEDEDSVIVQIRHLSHGGPKLSGKSVCQPRWIPYGLFAIPAEWPGVEKGLDRPSGCLHTNEAKV